MFPGAREREIRIDYLHVLRKKKTVPDMIKKDFNVLIVIDLYHLFHPF